MVSKAMRDMIHDDITWCADDKCKMTSCERNQVNRRLKTGLFSCAMFRGTDMCPLEKAGEQEKPWKYLEIRGPYICIPILPGEKPEDADRRFEDALCGLDAEFASYIREVADEEGNTIDYHWEDIKHEEE